MCLAASKLDVGPSGRGFFDLSHRYAGLMLYCLTRMRVHDVERLPLTGRLIIASNHLSNLDPLAVATIAHRETCQMAKHTLFWEPLGSLIRYYNAFPVRRGEADIGAVRTALRVLRDEKALIMFPEGRRSDGRESLDARKGVGLLATRTGAPVSPVYISGMDRVLGRGQLWVRRGPVDVFVGEPLTFSRETPAEEAASEVLKAIRDLREKGAQNRLDCPWALG